MHMSAHNAGASAKESIGKSFFVVRESQRNNGKVVLNGQAKSPVFKLVQHDGFVIGNAAFGKDTNAQALVYPFLRALKYRLSTFGIAAVYQNTRTGVEKTKQGDFCQFFLAHKYKGFWNYGQHQHNVGHRSVIGHKHITAVGIQLLILGHLVVKTTGIQNRFGPNARHHKKVGIPFFF